MTAQPSLESAFHHPAGGEAPSIAGIRIMFMYWGRRGLSRFVRELVVSAVRTDSVEAILSLSLQNEDLLGFSTLGARLFPVDTFERDRGAITQAWRLPLVRRSLAARLRSERTDVVIDLMPHVWSPFVISAIKGVGARYVCVLHDAVGHPGDRSGVMTHVLRRAAYQADHVLALSEEVGNRLLASGRLSPNRLTVLFHPDLEFASVRTQRRPPAPGAPLRLLFLGRILAYKGLPLFLDTVDRLRAEGVSVAPGIFGEGPIAIETRRRISAMGVELINRRLSDAEIGDVLLRYDALVASHVEASQSGVVAAALGAGLPCVATPVGGLVEQIVDGETGVVAEETAASALSAAVRRLFFTQELYPAVCANIARRRHERSMHRFLHECLDVAGRIARPLPEG